MLIFSVLMYLGLLLAGASALPNGLSPRNNAFCAGFGLSCKWECWCTAHGTGNELRYATAAGCGDHLSKSYYDARAGHCLFSDDLRNQFYSHCSSLNNNMSCRSLSKRTIQDSATDTVDLGAELHRDDPPPTASDIGKRGKRPRPVMCQCVDTTNGGVRLDAVPRAACSIDSFIDGYYTERDGFCRAKYSWDLFTSGQFYQACLRYSHAGTNCQPDPQYE
nr:KP6 preprotoxin [Ustilago maydis]